MVAFLFGRIKKAELYLIVHLKEIELKAAANLILSKSVL